MAKLDRILQKVFGATGSASEFGEIGSLADGAAVYTKDLDTIQAGTQFPRGLFGITAAGNEPPRIQDINALYLLLTSQIKYLFQAGIPEYIATEDYYIGSIVQVAGVLYTSIAGTNGSPNTGNAVSDALKWKKTLDVAELSGVGTNWPAALIANLATTMAHVMTTGLGDDWQAALEGDANTAVKTNVAASCSGNAATASDSALINGLSLAVGTAGAYGSHSIAASTQWVIPAGLYMMSVTAGTRADLENAQLQIKTGGIPAWSPSSNAGIPSGLILSDGINFAINNNNSSSTVTVIYRKLL